MIKVQENTVESTISIRIPFRTNLVPPEAIDYTDGEYEYTKDGQYYQEALEAAIKDWNESEMHQYIPEHLKEITIAPVEMVEDKEGTESAVLIVFNFTEGIELEDADELEDWVTGQMSDGWGEGFEQRPVYTYEDDYDTEYEDEDGEWVTDQERGTYEVLVNFWWHDKHVPWNSQIMPIG